MRVNSVKRGENPKLILRFLHEVKKVMLKLQRGETKWSQTELNVYDSYQEHQQQATVLIFISLKFNSDRFLKFISFFSFDCKPEVWEPRNRIVSADLHQFDILINFNWQSFTSSSFQFHHISLCSLQMFKQKLTALVSPAVAADTVASVLFTQHLKTSTCRSLRSPRDGVIIVLSAVVFPCGERWS